MPGPPPDVTTKRWCGAFDRLRPGGQHAGELARLLVVARPLDRLASARQVRLDVGVGFHAVAAHQVTERLFRVLAAVDAGRAEEHDGVLDVLRLEPAQRLEVLGEDSQRPGFFAFEKRRVEVGERLHVHRCIFPRAARRPRSAQTGSAVGGAVRTGVRRAAVSGNSTARGQVGRDADQHDRRRGGMAPRATRSSPMRRAAAFTSPSRSVSTGTTPHDSASRRAMSALLVAAKIGTAGRSADSTRAVLPPRVTATIAAALRVRGQRHRRLADGAAMRRRARASPRVAATPTGGIDLGVADDQIERLHRPHRIRADRRLAGQHDRVDAVVDGVGGVADLGARRPRLGAHRLEHLRGDDHRDAERARAPRDFLLHARHPLERQLEAEIAARDHHGVALRAGSRRGGPSPPAVRAWRPAAGAAPRPARSASRALTQVGGALHEAEGHEVDAGADAERADPRRPWPSGRTTAARRRAR